MQAMILSSLKEFAQTKAPNRRVAKVCIGLCYTAVILDNGSAGVAYTFRHDIPPGCVCFYDGGALAGDVFRPAGVDLLSGVVVRDSEAVLRVVSECGGMRNFKGYIKKVNCDLRT